MANSKIKVLIAYLSFILVLLSCNNTTQTNTDLEQLQQELKEVKAKLEAQNASTETKSLDAFQKNYDVFHPLGAFSTQEDLLQLHIPVSSKDFNIIQTEDISSKDINALIVRVTDSTSIDSSVIKDIVSVEQKLTDLNLDITKLQKHQKLKMIVINSTQAIEEDELDSLRECIQEDGTDYLAKSCWDAIRKVLKPNSKNGDIIIGG